MGTQDHISNLQGLGPVILREVLHYPPHLYDSLILTLILFKFYMNSGPTNNSGFQPSTPTLEQRVNRCRKWYCHKELTTEIQLVRG